MSKVAISLIALENAGSPRKCSRMLLRLPSRTLVRAGRTGGSVL
jgi:hypothetical protein